MSIESRPGMAAAIHMGHNYAQPSISPHAIPEGHQLQRALWWAGDRNSGCPSYDTNVLGVDDYSKRYGPEVTESIKPGAGQTVDTVIAALKRTWNNSVAATPNASLNEARLMGVVGAWAAEYE